MPTAGKVAFIMGLFVTSCTTQASEFTLSYHEASGGGTANLFDGGPAVGDSDVTVAPNDSDMGFFAIDSTRPGSLGASAAAIGRSQIFDLLDQDGIRVRVALDTSYRPSLFGGGDNPGGMAEGSLSSVIEFVMPADELIWGYQLRIRDTIDFEGSTSVLFENLTQSQTVLETTTEIFPPVETMLIANTGDLMRITTSMSGGGSTGPASTRQYSPTLSMTFIIPEPGTLLLLAFASIPLARRPHRNRR